MRGKRLVDKVLEATLEELSLHGFGALSMEQVAARAAVAKTTIYRRWPTKADLALDALNRAASDVVQAPDTGSIRRDLLLMVKSFYALASSRRGQSLMRMMIAEGASSEVASLARRIVEAKEHEPREVITRAIARGELPDGTDPGLLLDMLFGAVQHSLCLLHASYTEQQLCGLVDVLLLGAVHGGAVAKKRRMNKTASNDVLGAKNSKKKR